MASLQANGSARVKMGETDVIASVKVFHVIYISCVCLLCFHYLSAALLFSDNVNCITIN